MLTLGEDGRYRLDTAKTMATTAGMSIHPALLAILANLQLHMRTNESFQLGHGHCLSGRLDRAHPHTAYRTEQSRTQLAENGF
jgi:hypothetical protein